MAEWVEERPRCHDPLVRACVAVRHNAQNGRARVVNGG
jgi:hypothetical protein